MSFLPSSSCYHFSPSGYQTAAGIAFVMNRPGKRKADTSADSPSSPATMASPSSPAGGCFPSSSASFMPTASPFAFGHAANPFATAAPSSATPPREFKRRAIRAQDPVVPLMPPTHQVPPTPMDVSDPAQADWSSSLNAMAVEGADADADGVVGASAPWVPVTPSWALPLTGWSQYTSPSLELAQARAPVHAHSPSDAMDLS